jgi:ATP-binding cassette subfamily C protein
LVKKDQLILATNISFGYSPNHTIVDDVSCSLSRGSRIAILGINGAGKQASCLLPLPMYLPRRARRIF